MGTPHLTGRSVGCFGQEAQGGRALNRQPCHGRAQGQQPTSNTSTTTSTTSTTDAYIPSGKDFVAQAMKNSAP